MPMLLVLAIWLGFATSQEQLPAQGKLREGWAFPSQFHQLPAEFVKQLESRGCKIPQPYASAHRPKAANVIHGHFGSKKQTDWAVVCTIEDESIVFFSWGGPEHCASEINVEKDSKFSSKSTTGYEREITTATNKSIQDLLSSEELRSPVPISHDGIWDIYAEKDGTLEYCHEGTWLHHINGGH